MLNIVSQATASPVSLTELKDHLAISWSEDNDRLNRLLSVATEFVAEELDSAIYQTTYVDSFRIFPDVYKIPKPPFGSLTSIKYYENDVLVTLDADDYYISTSTKLGARLALTDNFSGNSDCSIIAWQVTFVAGPNQNYLVQQAIKMIAANLYENTEATTPLSLKDFPHGCKRILQLAKAGGYSG